MYLSCPGGASVSQSVSQLVTNSLSHPPCPVPPSVHAASLHRPSPGVAHGSRTVPPRAASAARLIPRCSHLVLALYYTSPARPASPLPSRSAGGLFLPLSFIMPTWDSPCCTAPEFVTRQFRSPLLTAGAGSVLRGWVISLDLSSWGNEWDRREAVTPAQRRSDQSAGDGM